MGSDIMLVPNHHSPKYPLIGTGVTVGIVVDPISWCLLYSQYRSILSIIMDNCGEQCTKVPPFTQPLPLLSPFIDSPTTTGRYCLYNYHPTVRVPVYFQEATIQVVMDEHNSPPPVLLPKSVEESYADVVEGMEGTFIGTEIDVDRELDRDMDIDIGRDREEEEQEQQQRQLQEEEEEQEQRQQEDRDTDISASLSCREK